MPTPDPHAPAPRRGLNRLLDSPQYFLVVGIALALMDAVFIADMFMRPATALSIALTAGFTAIVVALIWFGWRRMRAAKVGRGE